MTDYTALVSEYAQEALRFLFWDGPKRRARRGGHVGEGEFDAALGGVKGGTGRLTCADPIK